MLSKLLQTLMIARQRRRAKRALRKFIDNGFKPWTYGYEQYKWEHIAREIVWDDFHERVGGDKYGFRIDERAVEYPWFFSRLTDQPALMLDAGSALNFQCLLEHEKIRNNRLVIATLAPEKQAFWERGISYIYEDIRSSVFRDETFDLIACISTLEHVGMDNAMLYTSDTAKKENDVASWLHFLLELRRVLKPGGRLYLTMPYGKRKNHGWFQVFDAAMIEQLVDAFSPSIHSEEIFLYENDRWGLSERYSAKDAACFDIHAQKDYEPDFLAFSRSVVCLEMTKPFS